MPKTENKNNKILINLSILIIIAILLFVVINKKMFLGETNFLNFVNSNKETNINFKIKKFKKFNTAVLNDPNFQKLKDNTRIFLQNNRKIVGKDNPFSSEFNY